MTQRTVSFPKAVVHPFDRGLLWCWATLCLFTLLVFAPMFLNGFVWDDPAFIAKNPAIRGLWPPGRFFSAQGSVAQGTIYPLTGQRPVMIFSLAVDYALWKLNPFGYHLTNLLLHLLCVGMVVLLVQALSRSPKAGFLAGALFAFHPGHSEGVIAFLGRSDLLATLFVLGGFLLYWRCRNEAGWPKVLLYLVPCSAIYLLVFPRKPVQSCWEFW